MDEELKDFNSQQKEVIQLLKMLHDNKILPHVILAGSWAEYLFAQTGVLPGYTLTLRTIDIDFLIRNLRKPTQSISLPSIAKENGYTIAHDTLMGTTKLFSPDGLEIEFLISQKGSGTDRIMETNLGVNAQALRHMDIVIDNTLTVNFLGMSIMIPCPEIYVLHKIIINDERKPAKRIKDFNSILRLWPYMNYEKMGSICATLSKKEKSKVRTFLEKNGEEINYNLKVEDKIKFAEFISQNFNDLKIQKNERRIEK